MKQLSREPSLERFKAIVASCWRLLCQITSGCADAGKFVAEHALELMITQVPYGVQAIDTLIASFKNNAALDTEMNRDTPAAEKIREDLVDFTFGALKKYGQLGHGGAIILSPPPPCARFSG